MLRKCGLTLLSLMPLVCTALYLVVKSDFGVRPGTNSQARYLISLSFHFLPMKWRYQ